MLSGKALSASLTAGAEAVYIEDVFSTYLYTGNGSTQTITNNIDLSGEGGLVWAKERSNTGTWHQLRDTVRGGGQELYSNDTSSQGTSTSAYTFLSSGYSIGGNDDINLNTKTYASWTFRKAEKFFDVVTYTGNGANRTISHNLGSVPGCIIVKSTSAAGDWWVYHRSIGATKRLQLNDTFAEGTSSTTWNNTEPTSTQFSVGTSAATNDNGVTYVAYLFAHDAGGFGDAGDQNVISCGSYTGNGTQARAITLGFEPQWILWKSSSYPSNTSETNWQIYDNMRGWLGNAAGSGADSKYLVPNTSSAEAGENKISITPTGFTVGGASGGLTNVNGDSYIYIAIRRGPMKTSTSGTSVFQPVVYTGTNVDNRLVDMNLLTDMVFVRQRDDTVLGGMVVGDRLRGDPYLLTGTTAAEVSDADSFMTPTSGVGNSWSAMNGFGVGNDATSKLNASTTSNNQIAEGFRRAPGFFDVVCYTGTGSARTVSHNLGVAPEMMIVKRRDSTGNWPVYHSGLGATKYVFLNDNGSEGIATLWNDTAPTSSVFSLGTSATVNGSGGTYVAYLFGSVNGVSKVGTYTGTGTTLQINCGFTSGARFVLIRQVTLGGDWYLWDSARGIVAGNDPYLLINSTAAEVTNTDYIDSYSSGFEISSTAPAAINDSGKTFIYLAIA